MADDTTTTEEQQPARKGPQLTHTQAVNRCRELDAEIERLAGLDDPNPEEEKRFIAATEEFHETDKWRKNLEREAAFNQVRSVVTGELRTASTRYGQPRIKLEAGSSNDYDRDSFLEPDSIESHRFRNPWDLSEVRTFGRSQEDVNAELRSRALSAIEKMPSATDAIRSAATDIVEKFDDKDAKLARLALVGSSPEYVRAFSKAATNRMHELTKEESRAMEAVRALSLTDSAGGYLVPFQLDPTVNSAA